MQEATPWHEVRVMGCQTMVLLVGTADDQACNTMLVTPRNSTPPPPGGGRYFWKATRINTPFILILKKFKISFFWATSYFTLN